MTRQELGDASTSIVAEGAEITMQRIFDAPPALVWAAMTSAEHIHNWWGPHGTYASVEKMDVRPGGRWRIAPADGGEGIAFAGNSLRSPSPNGWCGLPAPTFPAWALQGRRRSRPSPSRTSTAKQR